MTWSLKLTPDGDLALGSASLGKVANEDKLIQDLKYELREKRGSDISNPDYGSNLDNEIGSNSEYSSVYGDGQVGDINIRIESDIAEVIRRYQKRQLARAMSDKMIRGAATLTPREAVVDFQVSEIVQNQTGVNVKINITTAKSNPNGYPVELNLSL
jgi:phage baseplate assembly protein W